MMILPAALTLSSTFTRFPVKKFVNKYIVLLALLALGELQSAWAADWWHVAGKASKENPGIYVSLDSIVIGVEDRNIQGVETNYLYNDMDSQSGLLLFNCAEHTVNDRGLEFHSPRTRRLISVRTGSPPYKPVPPASALSIISDAICSEHPDVVLTKAGATRVNANPLEEAKRLWSEKQHQQESVAPEQTSALPMQPHTTTTSGTGGPSFTPDDGTVLHITVEADGKVSQTKVVHSCGDMTRDTAVMMAVMGKRFIPAPGDPNAANGTVRTVILKYRISDTIP